MALPRCRACEACGRDGRPCCKASHLRKARSGVRSSSLRQVNTPTPSIPVLQPLCPRRPFAMGAGSPCLSYPIAALIKIMIGSRDTVIRKHLDIPDDTAGHQGSPATGTRRCSSVPPGVRVLAAGLAGAKRCPHMHHKCLAISLGQRAWQNLADQEASASLTMEVTCRRSHLLACAFLLTLRRQQSAFFLFACQRYHMLCAIPEYVWHELFWPEISGTVRCLCSFLLFLR